MPAANDIANNTSTTATIGVGETKRSVIDQGGDQDWFKITFSNGAAGYVIDVKGGKNAGELSDPQIVGIYDQNGAFIAGTKRDGFPATSENDDARLIFIPSTPGDYYIAIGGEQGATGEYTLTVSELRAKFIEEAQNGYTGFPYDKGNCTTYVAWRLSEEGLPNVDNLLRVANGRDAKNWDDLVKEYNTAKVLDYNKTGDLQQLVNHRAIAVWDENHVAFVERVEESGDKYKITVTESHYKGGYGEYGEYYFEVYTVGVGPGNGPGKMGSMPDHFIILP